MAPRRRRARVSMPKREGTDRYETWGAFVAQAIENADRDNPQCVATREPDASFYGVPWERALELAHGGWAEGWEKMTRMGADLARVIAHDVQVPAVAFDVSGDFIDMGAYLAGEPECCGYLTLETAPRPIVKIVANIAASWRVSARTIETRGMAILALIDSLERAGRRCDVVVAMGNSELSPDCYVQVKSPDEQVNPGLLAFVLCHDSMLRRVCFAYWEGWGHSQANHYGHPREVSERGDVYLPMANSRDPQWADTDSARRWVLTELERQGVKLIPQS